MARTAYDFDSVIIFTNPASKQAAVADKRIEHLRHIFPKKHFYVQEALKSITDTHAAMRRLIQRELDRNHKPILGIAGGDGSVNTIVQLLANPRTPQAIRNIPLIPLGTGNANDLAYMLYGNPAHPEKAFQLGKPIAIRPLCCTITKADGTQEQWLAANYISFGAIAHGAHELNKPAVRKLAHRRTWYSGVATDLHAIHAALQAPTFTIRHEGKSLSMRDVLIGNGERVGKVGRMPAHIDRPDLFVVMVKHTWIGRGALPLEVFKSMMGRAPGRLLRNTTFQFETLEDVYAQYDGEPSEVRAGSTVEITNGLTPFYVLSTRLVSEK